MYTYRRSCLSQVSAKELSTADESLLPYWQDIQTVAVNKEEPRTSFMSYPDKNSALNRSYEESPYYLSLNGTWKFLYVDGYKKLPENVTDDALDLTSWADIKVPGNWERQGYGAAVYVNHGYEFKARNPEPPLLPEANPVGVYRRTIDLSHLLPRPSFIFFISSFISFFLLPLYYLPALVLEAFLPLPV